MDQDDCPPPYHSVVQEIKISSNKNGRNSAAKNYDKHKNNLDGMEKCLSERQSNVSDENTVKTSLIPSFTANCIDETSNEISSLIESELLASSSSPHRHGCYRNEECTIRRKGMKDEFKVDVQDLQSSQLLRTEETGDNIDSTSAMECNNEYSLLDASGLPSYDTALKIQECGNN